MKNYIGEAKIYTFKGNEFKLSKEITEALDDFKCAIRDKHGKPLTPTEVNKIKGEIDRLAEGYEGM